MDYSQVKDLIKTINNSEFTEFELSLDGTFIKMSKLGTKTQNVSDTKKTKDFTQIKDDILSDEEIEEPITILPAQKHEVVNGNLVFSPIVGTFYNSPSPDKPVFFKVGDKVKKGDVLCIVEAMKIMNEIISVYDGEIAEIFVVNEQMVEYSQPLFRIV